MNKIKLEVIGITEDIISTSGICQHTGPDDLHMYVSKAKDKKGHNLILIFSADNSQPVETTCSDISPGILPGWYYKDEKDEFIPCGATHNQNISSITPSIKCPNDVEEKVG